MSVAGLRFGSDRSTVPLETKSGSYIYHGDAAHYHDWEFRTLLRIKLFDSKKDVEFSQPEGVPSPLGRTLKLILGFHPIRAQADQMTKPEPLPVEALKGMTRVEIVVS